MELKDISQKRQKKWKETDLYKVRENSSKPKFYILDMFPYPSGSALHVGHPKGFMATDVLARKKMLEGFNVLHPMGFDTFGLWTEQYAIEHKMKPLDVSKKNIAKFIQQLESFWTTYDRSRSVNTADPKYFKRTQRIFLQLYTHYYDEKLKKAMPIAELKLKIENWRVLEWGKLKINGNIDEYLNKQRLAYVDYKPINRCPKCMTWLANEDLDDGKCERCGSEVEQKPMKQRVLRITKYAERLIEWLDDLKREESMKDLERNRIGKSEWTQFQMVIANDNVISNDSEKSPTWQLSFEVYTTRIDTAFWMSFVAIAPEHPLVEKITTTEHKANVEKYKEAANKKTQLERTELQKEKTGVFCGAYAINPFNNEKVPIFVADYVLANYGTWVVMAVPAHDERDFEFAKKYNLPIKQSIMFVDQRPNAEAERRHTISAIIQRKSDSKFLFLKWKKFGWFSPVIGWIEWDEDVLTTAEREVLEETGYTVKAVKKIGRLSESNFFAENKNIRRQRIDQPVVLELVNEMPAVVDGEELEKHEVIWLTYEEAIAQTTHKDNTFGITAFVKWESAFGEYGRLIDSGEFTWLFSEEAISAMQARLEKKWIGWVKVNYRMQDRVFSRQRYRGEPFPILRVENEPKFSINFYEQKTWKAIVDGVKTIETRALNPEEPERYFGDVKVDDIIKFINKETKEELFVKVTKVHNWDNFDALWNEDKHIIEKIYTNKKTFAWIKTIEEFKKWWDFQAGYVDKIEKNGLVGREFEIVKPTKKIIALDEKELPLELPDVENYEPTGTEEWPLANIDDWVNVTLPDGTKAKRETNTMPGRAGSSRYWLRYMDVNNDKAMVGKDKEAYRGSVDVYVGGAEHITRHMIYGRFWQKFLFDIGVISHDEPFQEYHSVGLIMGEDGRKMSKRRGNVVNPDDIINEFWTDVLRAYEMFMGPFDQSIARSTNGIKGIKKFLDKIVLLKEKIGSKEQVAGSKEPETWNLQPATLTIVNQTIKKVGEDIDGFRFNTAISQLMILVNHLTDCTTITKKTFEDLVLLVSPFAPHLAEELWEQLGNEYSVFTKATWPTYDEKCLVADTVNIGVQINGKVRGTICISKEAEENEVMQLAKADEKIAAWIVSEPKKVIYVKGKILNIVV